MKTSSRALLCVVSAVLLLAACGSSADDEATTELTNEAPVDAGDGEATATTEVAAETTVAETAPPEPAGSVVRVSGGSTEPWEIPGYCEWTPDNDGPASSLYVVEDTDDERTEGLTILEVWPISIEDDSTTSIIGSIEEPDGNALFVIGVEPSFDGETITLLTDVHSGLKGADDPPDFTLTITCTP